MSRQAGNLSAVARVPARIWAPTTIALLLLATTAPMVAAQASPEVVAWRVYAVCVAAFVEEVASRDMATAYAGLKRGAQPRSPEPAEKLVREGLATCRSYREKLVALHRAENPQVFVEKHETRMASLLARKINEIQIAWQRSGYFGSPSAARTTDEPNPFAPPGAR